MKKLNVKELRGIVNSKLDLTIKELEMLTNEDYQEVLQASKELVSRNIKKSDKEDYEMFIDTLMDLSPKKEEPKKVANKKAPKKEAPKKDAPKKDAPKKEAKAPETLPEAPEVDIKDLKLKDILTLSMDGYEDTEIEIRDIEINHGILARDKNDYSQTFSITESDLINGFYIHRKKKITIKF